MSFRPLALGLTGIVALFGLIQLVPYGRQHANPPAGASPAWDSPRTLELARRACFDCHSNETKWPWYASIAPISWRIQRHVDEGRAKLNLTAFDAASRKMTHAAGEASEEVTKGEMPLSDYLLMHAEARLTATEKQELARGLDATFAAFGEGRGGAAGGAADSVRAGSGERGEAGESEEEERREHGEHGH